MKTLVAVIAFFSVSECFSQSLKTDTTPIQKLNEIYTKAVEAGDSIALKSIFAEYFVITGGNGVQRDRDAELKDLVLPDTKVHYFKIENEKYFVYENSAVVTGQLNWRMTSNGRESDFRRVFTFMYSRFGREWKIIAQHIGRMPL
jgi:ketosteroid isomerase-like protein